MASPLTHTHPHPLHTQAPHFRALYTEILGRLHNLITVSVQTVKKMPSQKMNPITNSVSSSQVLTTV